MIILMRHKNTYVLEPVKSTRMDDTNTVSVMFSTVA